MDENPAAPLPFFPLSHFRWPMHHSGYWRGLSEWTARRSAIRVVCLFGKSKSSRVARVGRTDRRIREVSSGLDAL
jgi:hypothetical protein